ncbi:restriction endonuclease subunit S [Mycoplasma sp. E35C]|uniref:restriction endonuclease subunit S n=1 Tax=Mycoplasma sp. E35C TaxID=2801918 RepID=UPI001CA3BD74|nr:restriction endonuclease subunit S [Mycoplasma sp. E35C]QZX49326.1 restriction endonuclease subunit S [Mycoplasma sp. E35C]
MNNKNTSKYSIEELCNLSLGTLLTKNKNENGKYKFFTTSKEEFRINSYSYDCEAILINRSCDVGGVKYYNGKFDVQQKVFVLNNFSKNVLVKYVYYYLKHKFKNHALKNVKKGAISNLVNNDVLSFVIKIPNLEQQKNIIKNLDNLNRLLNLSEKELELRKRQFNYYLYKLITKENKGKKYKISDICSVKKGESPIKKTPSGEYHFVTMKKEGATSNKCQFDCKAVCVPLVSSVGSGVAKINYLFYQEGKFDLGNILCALIPKDEEVLNVKYLYYYLYLFKDVKLTTLMRGGANVAMKTDDVADVKISFPPIEKQKEIVEILDVFTNYTQKLEKEIELRKLQLEYYQNQLLTFDK